MSKTIPSYLRIHRGPRREHHRPPNSQPSPLDQFWLAYTEATGWRVDNRRARRSGELSVVPAVVDGITTPDEGETIPAVGRSDATRLAVAAANLARRLRQSEETIRRQEAELATRAAVLAGDECRDELATRFDEILADAALACRCDAAAMYLLDDDTRYLTARAVHNLPADRLGGPPRELRGSRGDLEAFVQNVVAVGDAQAETLQGWNFPEPFPAGVCASINDGDLPIGTLWLFAAERTTFGAGESAAARLAASHLAAEIGRAAAQEARVGRAVQREAILDVAAWQHRMLPLGSELAKGWKADGMIESHRDWAVGWHVWDVLPDGSLMLAMAEAVDGSMNGAMTAAAARAALTAHCSYRHTPQQLLRRIGDTLWESNSGDQLLSLLYARIDPATGEGEVAVAGTNQAIIASRYGYRPVVEGNHPPLGTHIDSPCGLETFRLGQGESLLVYGGGLASDGAGQQLLGETLRDAMERTGTPPLAALRRAIADLPLRHERGAAILTRR